MTEIAQPGCDTVPDMTPEQDEAVAAQDASARRYTRADAAMADAREQAVEDALRSLRLGVPPSVVERHSPFTGSYIRRLARNAGIKGDPRYDRTGGSR